MATIVSESKVRRIVIEIFLLCLTLIIIVPLFMLILGAFKNEREAAALSLSLPSHWQVSSVFSLFTNNAVLHAFWNSLNYTFVSTTGSLLFNSMTAYILARRENKLTIFLYYILVAGLMIPPLIIPQIRAMQQFHLMNTYAGTYLLYICANIPFSVFFFTGFMKSIPRALDEAAYVDGATPLRTFFRIILPLLIPVCTTVGVFIAIFVWNDFQTPLYYINSTSHWPITMWIYRNVSQHLTLWNDVFAKLLLSIMPMVIVYVIAQRYIISGMTAGAVKS